MKAKYAVGSIVEFRRNILKIERVTKRYRCAGSCKMQTEEESACSRCDGFMYTGILLAGRTGSTGDGRGNFAGCFCRKLSKEEAVFYLL